VLFQENYHQWISQNHFQESAVIGNAVIFADRMENLGVSIVQSVVNLESKIFVKEELRMFDHHPPVILKEVFQTKMFRKSLMEEKIAIKVLFLVFKRTITIMTTTMTTTTTMIIIEKIAMVLVILYIKNLDIHCCRLLIKLLAWKLVLLFPLPFIPVPLLFSLRFPPMLLFLLLRLLHHHCNPLPLYFLILLRQSSFLALYYIPLLFIILFRLLLLPFVLV